MHWLCAPSALMVRHLHNTRSLNLANMRAGVASAVAPVLPVLDALYATRAVLERLARRHGNAPAAWPPGVRAVHSGSKVHSALSCVAGTDDAPHHV